MTTETRREYWLDKPEEYWASFGDDGFLSVPNARPISLPSYPEMDVFAYQGLLKHPDWKVKDWIIIDSMSGARLSDPMEEVDTLDLDKTIAATEARIRKHGGLSVFVKRRNEHIEAHGCSPRYRLEEYDD